jgi:C4-dicarboxylate transporter, DctQ subunit
MAKSPPPGRRAAPGGDFPLRKEPAAMVASFLKFAGWLRRRAENVAVILLVIVFASFLLQITFRYLLGWPVGWTLEVSTLAWMWLVLWGAAFVVRERDEVRFDILYSAVGERLRRGFVVVTGLALAAIFAISLPAVIDYVTFMRVEKASYIGVRLDYLFSIYVLFALAVILRSLFRAWAAVRGDAPETTDPSRLREE